ncbi:MAG TPA: mismatch repair protein [Gammaproteobacteria bacterium]|nr:mismatch repair protein [Gammaproteobacteria bacterium]
MYRRTIEHDYGVLGEKPAAAAPIDEYHRRLKTHEAQAELLERVHERVANLRLVLAIAIAAIAWFSLYRHAISFWWLIAFLAAFIVAVLYHRRLRHARSLAVRIAAMYRDGIARIEDRWVGTGSYGERFEDPRHVYAADLDLFGRGGVFELLSRARTRMGEDALARWLLSPSPVGEIRERQAAVAELRGRLDLRQDLAVLGDESGAGVNPDALVQWAEAPNRFTERWLRWLPPALAGAAVAAAVAWGLTGLFSPFLAVVLIEGAVTYRLRKRLDEVLKGTEHAFADLELLSAVLACLEREQFEAPKLRSSVQKLTSRAVAASRAIARFRTRVQFIESRRNPIVRVFDVPLMYSVQLARSAEEWRGAHGPAVQPWLEAAGEIEALISLAAFSYEHPSDPFPDFIDGPASFHAQALCHPLLPSTECVRNHVSLSAESRVLLVSGSNMSGKSTLLRAVGVNTVLAMAGATVRAERLRLTPLQVGASIRITDSLQEGSSRFYAEITRLREIYTLAAQAPALMFLLDELLQGTNSKDRRIGAEGMLRSFVARGAIGLVSTHDLALTDMSGPNGRYVHNVHFQDELENGRMTFDFKLRDGVATKSNGIELMRSIGIEI